MCVCVVFGEHFVSCVPFYRGKVCVRICSRVIDILHMRSSISGGEFIALLSLKTCAGCKGNMCVCETLCVFFVKLEIDLNHVNIVGLR